jgi:hypothetical protein
MKQGKIVNLNVKIRLSRIPTKKEKQKLIELIANILDSGCGDSDYDLYLRDLGDASTLGVEHHYVTERKMGKV